MVIARLSNRSYGASDGATSYSKGVMGEKVAVSFLRQMGHVIIARRFKTKYGEIDIISEDRAQNLLLFVEIKMRKHGSIALRNMELISNNQILRNCRSASYFLSCEESSCYCEHQMRFDLALVDCVSVVRYIENAWEYLDE